MPSVADRGFHTELAADLARETAKQDELEDEGVAKAQQDAFKRVTGYLDE
ncbi:MULTISPECIES: hypothetical protein [Saccharothrix]|nr:hypothetical protein [Saccharothrix sp. CB00851]